MNAFAFLRKCNPVWHTKEIKPYRMTELRCSQCNELKTAQQFYRSTRARSGIQQPCKECRRG